ncbi:hypothetical protein B0H13DRAFT_784233 [Mycena leptocephala]|jgi:hypothetical protein|nr:hypothetical protein B0H13DRAFT_784233 [Mycena leptocephala]
MSRSITVEYTINPPPSSGQSYELPTSKKHDFKIQGSVTESEHYKMLRESIAQARQEVGQELTAWRDAVGKAELNKETKKAKTDDDDDEEEDGDDA